MRLDAMVDTCVPKITYSQEGFWDLVRLYVGYCTIRSHANTLTGVWAGGTGYGVLCFCHIAPICHFAVGLGVQTAQFLRESLQLSRILDRICSIHQEVSIVQ